MKIERVIWSKGTLLNPQHLQAQDRYFEALLHFKLDALAFRPWGFLSVLLDRHNLAAGTIQLMEASGIFPDGLAFEFPQSEPAPPPRNLIDCFGPDQKAVNVFLTVPPYQEGGINIVNPEMQVDARFRSEFTMMRDENTGGSEKPVPLARKNLRLLVENEIKGGGAALQVAVVRRTPAGGFELDQAFVPPVIDFRASDQLKSISREMVATLAARSSEISGNRRPGNEGLVNFTSSDIANFWLLYTINSHLPVLRDFHENRFAHPELLYSELLRLAAELTTFSREIAPKDLPKYDHQDLGTCFADLRNKLRILLETAVPRNFVGLPLKLVKPSIFATALDDAKYLTNTRMYFSIRTKLNKGDVIQMAPQKIKLSSASQIEHLVRQALPGLALSYVGAPPGFTALKPDFHYFSIAQSGAAWEDVCRAQNFGAFVPAEFKDVELELIIVLPNQS